ncbi:hypothetical protein BABINDRAFT_163491 [Babjeviella inositovora NRRL Y-12698]|uniref:Uncharacterized protein n=1 Tax=Babjeviella inositovora NRRL Y-12698 TaxID=984486 RepID=A0A1E3QIF8_9ASCO|nr:uncharacterized protein BABINDRAFT_163491 [Babjeviella inositovora NRRL Y-12698]ODQ77481.1 hypothetical protein BABINDRAFT_163491 [Babjeviella inositovora NRRL Y-12698]
MKSHMSPIYSRTACLTLCTASGLGVNSRRRLSSKISAKQTKELDKVSYPRRSSRSRGNRLTLTVQSQSHFPGALFLHLVQVLSVAP